MVNIVKYKTYQMPLLPFVLFCSGEKLVSCIVSVLTQMGSQSMPYSVSNLPAIFRETIQCDIMNNLQYISFLLQQESVLKSYRNSLGCFGVNVN